MVRHVSHEPVKDSALGLEEQVLAHFLLLLGHEEANDLVEVAAEDWQHFLVVSRQEVLNQCFEEAGVPLWWFLVLLDGGSLILSIGLLQFCFRLFRGLFILKVKLVDHGLFLFFFIL